MLHCVYTPRVIVPHDKYVAETRRGSKTKLCPAAGNKTIGYNLRVVRYCVNETSVFWFQIARRPLIFPPGVSACAFLFV